MRRSGRPVVDKFEPQERLFYRLDTAYPVGEAPSGLSVRKPDFSTNREALGGKPIYVLLPEYPDYGIAEFKVVSLPASIPSEGGREYSWAPTHVPLEDNYYHSEVRTYKDRIRCEKSSQVNALVYRIFRQRLSEAMRVIKSYERNMI